MRLPGILHKGNRGPLVLSMILTVFAWNAISFGWFGLPNFGFFTSGGAHRLASAKVDAVAVPLAAELCALKFNAQSPAIVADKVQKLRASSYTYAWKQELKPDWIRLDEGLGANDGIVDSCTKLILSNHPEKSADLRK